MVEHQHNPSADEIEAPVYPDVLKVAIDAPLGWLAKGWEDLVATRFVGVAYGALFVIMGYAITWIYANQWQLTMGLIGGFFLMGPFLCMGLYDLSRQREAGETVSLLKSFGSWKNNLVGTGFFAIMLAFAMIVWTRVSVLIFALSSTTAFPTLQGVLDSLFSLQNPIFTLSWFGIGFIFASIVFAISVVSPPMLLDRHADTFMAVITSVKCLLKNPAACYLWAALVTVIIGASLFLGFLPLLLTAPLVGHASWHAYRAMVDESSQVNA